MNKLDTNNQNNCVTVLESDLNNLVEDQLDTKDFELGIEIMMRDMGLNESEEYKALAQQGLER